MTVTYFIKIGHRHHDLSHFLSKITLRFSILKFIKFFLSPGSAYFFHSRFMNIPYLFTFLSSSAFASVKNSPMLLDFEDYLLGLEQSIHEFRTPFDTSNLI